MNGVPLMVVAKNLGHKDTRMVEKHYGHLAPSYVAAAIRKRRGSASAESPGVIEPFTRARDWLYCGLASLRDVLVKRF